MEDTVFMICRDILCSFSHWKWQQLHIKGWMYSGAWRWEGHWFFPVVQFAVWLNNSQVSLSLLANIFFYLLVLEQTTHSWRNHTDLWNAGQENKELRAQMEFSSLIPIKIILKKNNWLNRWCQQEQFGFFHNRNVFLSWGTPGKRRLNLHKNCEGYIWKSLNKIST